MKNTRLVVVAMCAVVLAGAGPLAGALGVREGRVYTVPTSASAEPERILPGGRVGPITASMTRDQVIRTLGKPDAIYLGDARYTLRDNPFLAFYVFSKAGLSILFQWQSIVAIGILSEHYEYGKGVRVGMNGTTAQGILGPFEMAEIRQSDGSIDKAYGTYGTGASEYRLQQYSTDFGHLFLKVNTALNRVSEIIVFAAVGDYWPPGEFWVDDPLSAADGAKVRASLSKGMGAATTPLERYALTMYQSNLRRAADNHPLDSTRTARTFSLKGTTRAEILGRESAFDQAFAQFGTTWPTAAEIISTVGLPHTFLADYLGQADIAISVMYYGDNTLIFGTDGMLSNVFFGQKSTYKTEAGIGNGSTLDAVLSAYGAPLRTLREFPLDYDTDKVLYLYGDRNAVAYIRYHLSGYLFYAIDNVVVGFSREWRASP
jgi:hypothetical protein